MDSTKGAAAHEPVLTRRRLLSLGGAALATAVVTGLPLPAKAALFKATERRLSFVNLHNDERIDVVYHSDGRYVRGALNDLNHALRDWRTGDVTRMDVSLFDTLWLLRQRTGSRRPFELISAYRSPVTNAKLAKHSSGVAKQSYHMKGMAVDVNLPDVALRTFRQHALTLAAGGVGYYPRSEFVHIDVGPVRHW